MIVRYTADLGVEVPEALRKDVLGKLWYVAEGLTGLELDAARADRVHFELATPEDGVAAEARARMIEVAKRMVAGYRPASYRVLAQLKGPGVGPGDDPHPGLVASSDLHHFGRGRWGLGPLASDLVELLESDLHSVGLDLATAPHRFPTLIGADTLASCKYFESFPHSLTFASHLREDLGAIQSFAREARVVDGHLAADSSAFASPECLLSPAVCFHLYQWLAGSRLTDTVRARASGKCFRYESGGLDGLGRLWDFTMSECIAVGTQTDVLAFREQGLERSLALFEAWGLTLDVHTATDPFFVDVYAKQALFQAAFDLKFEASATLPYRKEPLAIGSFNYHQDFFGRAFDIQSAEGRPAHTACVAFGIERFVLAFLAQHGTAPRHWPAAVRDRLPESA
ncbi:MAG: hypothetical protein ACHQU8_06490 [Gemmatimonadales bacterium]